jgi:chaperonin cofactor prefoldin
VNARQVATGTLLAASLTIGGASIADASPSRPAMDRGEVQCERIEHRIDQLEHHQAMLAARRERVQAHLDDAVADDNAHRVARLEAQLRQVDRAAARIQARIDEARGALADLCAPRDES